MPPKLQFIGNEDKAIPYLLWAKKQWLLREGTWTKATDDCIIQFHRDADLGWIRFIVLGADILCHPRTGSLRMLPYFDADMNQMYLPAINAGGLRPKNNAYEDLETRFVYPLVDQDRGTWGIEKGDASISWQDEENYGNNHWVGDGVVFTWKGPPNNLPVNVGYSIPGLTQIDGRVNTCFSNTVYSEGAALFALEPVDDVSALVVGAMRIDSILCCIAVYSSRTLKVLKSIDSGKSWTVIYSEDRTISLTSAHISKSGLVFSYGDCLYTIDSGVSAVTKANAVSTPSGTRTWGDSISYKASKELWHQLDKANQLGSSMLSVTAFFSKTGSKSESKTSEMVPVYIGNPATEATVTNSGGVLSVSANGTYCNVTWSGDINVDGGTVRLEYPDGSCAATATATLQPQGVIATYSERRLASKVISSEYSYDDWHTPGGCCTPEGFVYSEQTDSGRQAYGYVTITSPSTPFSGGLVTWGTLQNHTNVCASVCAPDYDEICHENSTGWSVTVNISYGAIMAFDGGFYYLWSIGGVPGGGIKYDWCTGNIKEQSSNADCPPDPAYNPGHKFICEFSPSFPQATGGYEYGTGTQGIMFEFVRTGTCNYLGNLPSEIFDIHNEPITLPTLAADQMRVICRIDTLVC